MEFEIGSVTFWVGLEGKKPFPVTLYPTKEGVYTHKTHQRQNLSANDKQEVATFVRMQTAKILEVYEEKAFINLAWEFEEDM